MQDYKGGLAVHSFSASIPNPICILRLPDIPPGEPDGLYELVASQLLQTSEGYFRPDPEHSIVAVSRRIREGDDASGSFLLIPCGALRAQARSGVSSQGITTAADSAGGPHMTVAAPQVRVVIWEDWGPTACLHLRLPVDYQHFITHSSWLPFGSRMPLVVPDSADVNRTSICVFELNPLAARYARSLVAGRTKDESELRATAIVAPEDLESVLPGVSVDPDCSAIPYAVYRFALSDSPTEEPRGDWPIRRVQMDMTGFTVTFDDSEHHEREQTWAI
ncbi:hypothetical protein GSI_02762 [Ganoderma sinense ZZ0214-1]|uniref:Uncharacterized protein n=1 Tax=Ganoderma sinense ZZ0214-1 TaxID=1077348 RepID=A0A2G8SMI1_9APHY|nr:hypothetical protein GSI_02762 [Ganoderma sinense ZZ0214-1]